MCLSKAYKIYIKVLKNILVAVSSHDFSWVDEYMACGRSISYDTPPSMFHDGR